MDSGAITLAVVAFRQALTYDSSFTDSRISLASCLRELGHAHLAYSTIKDQFCLAEEKTERQKLMIPLVESLLGLASSEKNSLRSKDLEQIVRLVETAVQQNIGNQDPCRAGLLMTQLWIQLNQLDRALESRDKLVHSINQFFSEAHNKKLHLKKSFHTQWHGLNWNLGIKCLKQGRLKDGWSLYEHGLQSLLKALNDGNAHLKNLLSRRNTVMARRVACRNVYFLWVSRASDSMMFASLMQNFKKRGKDHTFSRRSAPKHLQTQPSGSKCNFN